MNTAKVAKSLNDKFSISANAKVLVVGLGETGYSVAKFLHQIGVNFAVVDSRDKPPLIDALLQDFPDTPVFTGGFDTAAFEVATHIVVSPGVSLQEAVIQKAIQAKVTLVSDIDLFACVVEQPVVAITGSNGKSTVTTMLGLMGNEAGIKTVIGGNLGVPALDLLDDSVELYVLELSSFQLERTSMLNAKAATVLNVSADHMDRHDDIQAYAKEKQRVFLGTGVMVINNDDPIVKNMQLDNRKVLHFSVQGNEGFHLENRKGENWLMNGQQYLMRQSEIALEGLHNISNALAAFALGTAVGLDAEAMSNALRRFNGLEHRMQRVAHIKGVTWVNDSKATNIGACMAALQGYQEKVILIAGGDGKGADFSELAPVIKKKAKCVVLMGRDAPNIERAIKNSVPLYKAKDMAEAVKLAATIAEAGESVLLSPACASLDQYTNYQERGNCFAHAVMEFAA